MAAIVNICVDPRLDHQLLRVQVGARLQRLTTSRQRLYITNDIGGNIGSAFRSTAELILKGREEIVLAAVLHHDDCVAERLGLRRPLAGSAEAAARLLEGLKVTCPVLTGSIRTEDNYLTWSDEPGRRYELLTFRMPRLYG